VRTAVGVELAAEQLPRRLLSIAGVGRQGDRDCPFTLALGEMKEQGPERWRAVESSSPALAVDRDQLSRSDLPGKPRPVSHPPEQRIRVDLRSADHFRLVSLDGCFVEPGVIRPQTPQKLTIDRLDIADAVV